MKKVAVKKRVVRKPASGKKIAAKKAVGKLVIFGVGLIGGSFALALKQQRAVGHVVGVGRTRANLLAAKRLGKTVVGIDQEERYCAIAAERCAQMALPLALP